MTAVTINSVYPWGRSFEEYRRMLALSDIDLGLAIAGCGNGPGQRFHCLSHSRQIRAEAALQVRLD
jgi:hypothetical protein